MTSPSPRNLRITASSTPRRTRSSKPHPVWSLLAACAVGAGSLLATGAAGAGESPLERLQQRSGDSRWDELRARVRSGPATLSPIAPGAAVFNAANDLPADDETAPPAPADLAPPAPEEDGPFAAESLELPAAGLSEPTVEFEQEANPELFPQRNRSAVADTFADPAPHRVFLEAEAPPAPGVFDDQQSSTPLRAKPLLLRPITDIQPFYDYSPTGGDPCEHLCPAPEGLCPDDPNRLCPEPLAMPMGRSPERYFPHLEYYWAASNLYHNPLYFENPALERYGHVHLHDCVEPVYSMARFGVQLAGLPYQMALDSACRHQYALGWYRPGDFAPKLVYQPPLNARAAGTAAAAYTGLFLLVP